MAFPNTRDGGPKGQHQRRGGFCRGGSTVMEGGKEPAERMETQRFLRGEDTLQRASKKIHLNVKSVSHCPEKSAAANYSGKGNTF